MKWTCFSTLTFFKNSDSSGSSRARGVQIRFQPLLSTAVAEATSVAVRVAGTSALPLCCSLFP